MTLLFGENVSRAFLKAVRVSGKGTKESKGKKKGRKESGSRKRKLPAAEGKKQTQAQTHGQYGHKKAPKRFCFRAPVKTATTYSPTCAVPSA